MSTMKFSDFQLNPLEIGGYQIVNSDDKKGFYLSAYLTRRINWKLLTEYQGSLAAAYNAIEQLSGYEYISIANNVDVSFVVFKKNIVGYKIAKDDNGMPSEITITTEFADNLIATPVTQMNKLNKKLTPLADIKDFLLNL